MADANVLRNLDLFFYYGKSDLELETEHDLYIGLLQEKRSAFYYRDYGAGVGEYENAPISLATQVGLRFDIVDFAARRNAVVSDGSNGRPDRRVSTSQSAIRVERDGRGELDVTVLYVPFSNIENVQELTVSTGGPSG